jgi:predicted lipoprotein with Yx(FWY)xxD motif
MRGEHRRTGVGHVIDGLTRTRLVAVMVAAALAAVGHFAAGAIAGGTTKSSATLSLRRTSLGMILVTANGHTLYQFGKDRNDKSACSGTCAQFWPPLVTRRKPTAGPGVKASLLGTTKRSDGSLQVTYNRHPLYGFVLDKSAGQTNGEGLLKFGAKWYALSASGAAIITGAATTTSPYTPTTTSNYP